MAAVIFAFQARKSAPSPWQNHELAELFRAVDILGKAGLKVDTEFGLSDDGDPWFVFCRADTGEVLVHIARIDGQYVAASLAVEDVVRGADFRDIVNQIVRRQPLVVPTPAGGSRLFMHPAVVLTAFIAAALLHSHQAEAADNLLPSAPVSLLHDKGDGSAAGLSGLLKQFFAETFIPLRHAAVGSQPDDPTRDSAPSAFLASLVAIAIAAIEPTLKGIGDDASWLSSGLPLSGDGQAAPAQTASAGLFGPTALFDSASAASSSAPVQSSHDSPASAAPAKSGMDDQATPVMSLSLLDHLPGVHSDSPPHDQAAATASAGEVTIDHSFVRPVVQSTANSSVQASTQSTTTITALVIEGHVLTPEAVKAFVSASADHQTATTAVATTTPTTTTTASVVSSNSATGDGISGYHIDADGGLQIFVSSAAALPSSGGQDASLLTSGTLGVQSMAVISPIATTGYDPVATLTAVVDYVFSGQHALSGSFKPSDYLTFAVKSYELANPGPVELVVYDSKSLPYTVFPLTQGVLFVDDHQLTSSQQLTVAQADTASLHLANGGSITLIGIITAGQLGLA
jgi:hypothetical protein